MRLMRRGVSDHFGIRAAMGVGFGALILCLVALMTFSNAQTRKKHCKFNLLFDK